MIDTNLKGLLYMTREVSTYMIANKKGHILNIGSVAGKEVYPRGNVYCATKHAVDALNKGMRIDLLPHGIKVTGVHPGMLESEFSLVRLHGDEEKAKAVYQGIHPLYPIDVAEVIWFAVNQPKHVCLNDIVMTCTAQASARDSIRD
jgi:NADP-dependent 3-hydroxy acid dehydrogenase YdfG